ncbi:MAG: helix-turn-helix domain-containing protein [Saonia sp.]
MRQLGILFVLSTLIYLCGYANTSVPSNTTSNDKSIFKDSIAWADYYYNIHRHRKAIDLYKKSLKLPEADQLHIYKRLALSEAALENSENSSHYIDKYFFRDFNTSFLQHEGFDIIRQTDAFESILKKYSPNTSIWSFIYLYVAFIGFYVVIVLNFNKKIDRCARILIAGFIFIHSFFILHICINITNYQYEYPHSYLMSTSFSFLYGPLLYFYFKRTTQQYKFKIQDLLHLAPTILFLIYIIPIYILPANEKLNIMLNRASIGLNSSDSDKIAIIAGLKLLSLIIYGYFIREVYLKSKKQKELGKQNRNWQRNLYRIHILYIFAYAVYGFLISTNMSSGFFYHFQIMAMALMVLYVGYSAYVQPNVFSGIYSLNNQLFFKYKNSGLTESLSEELKENLISLFDEFKIYKENDISLEILAERLNTTRHNASQVINEHFRMNFHELINTYRINEAKEILDNDRLKNLNIIDVAYEVGYNNKVTFNKAFKKDTNLTPTEYQKKTFKNNLTLVNRT